MQRKMQYEHSDLHSCLERLGVGKKSATKLLLLGFDIAVEAELLVWADGAPGL